MAYSSRMLVIAFARKFGVKVLASGERILLSIDGKRHEVYQFSQLFPHPFVLE